MNGKTPTSKQVEAALKKTTEPDGRPAMLTKEGWQLGGKVTIKGTDENFQVKVSRFRTRKK
jgi:hypothetical protein